MTGWVIMAATGLGTLLLRSSFTVFVGDRRMPDTLTRALRFVPAAVMTALVTPAVFLVDGRLDLTFDNLRWPAAAVAAVVAWKTGNIAYTIAVGMVTLWIAQALL